jgi:hypothetical protein
VPVSCFVAIAAADKVLIFLLRRGAGVVERDGLENRCTGNRTVGSNPTLSAICWKFFNELPEQAPFVGFRTRTPAKTICNGLQTPDFLNCSLLSLDWKS